VVKSLFTLVVILCGILVCFANITNISQCINTDLTAEVLSRFPSNSTVKAQNCVLAFVKGSVNGDLRIFAAPFSDEVRFSEFGISGLDNIPAAISNEFFTLMKSVSNCTSRVILYNEVTNNRGVKADITLRRQGIGYNRVEVCHLDIVHTNNSWRIAQWDVDE